MQLVNYTEVRQRGWDGVVVLQFAALALKYVFPINFNVQDRDLGIVSHYEKSIIDIQPPIEGEDDSIGRIVSHNEHTNRGERTFVQVASLPDETN